MTRLTFYSDPFCPWAWRTSLWIREVQRQRPLEIAWKLFNLAEINHRPDPALRVPHRVLVLARREGGNDSIDRLLLALSNAQHKRRHDIRKREGLEAAIEEAGFDRALVQRALDDPSTEEESMADHHEAVEKYGAFGVPWLVPAGQDFGFYGPVIDTVPQGDDALELWEHVSWLLTQPYFFEIKRERG